MTPAGLWRIAWAAMAVACFGATGVKVLQEFSRHQLDRYCRGRGRRELFKEIVGQHDAVSVGAESLQVVGAASAMLCGAWAVALRWNGAVPSVGETVWLVAGASLLLLTFTSWIPWAVTRVWSAPFLYHTWMLWKGIHVVGAPLSLGVEFLSGIVSRLAGRVESEDDDADEQQFEDEIRTIVSQGIGDGVIEEDAREMIEGVMELDESDVGDVMTPRSRVDALEVNTSWNAMLEFVTRVRRTRIPVYEESIDRVLGILYVKDLLPFLVQGEESPLRELRSLLREPMQVLKTFPLDEMLQKFLTDRSHMAIVVGEFGTVEGVVTIEDVLEEIVGEIADETDGDKAEDLEIEKVDEDTTLALGKTHVMDLNQELGLGIPEGDDYDTIGGFVTRHLGRIPKADDYVESDGVRITVVEADDRHVRRVRLQRLWGMDD